MGRDAAYREAEERIEKARRSRATKLNLSGWQSDSLKLSELPESLSQLTQLQTLDVSSNRLATLPGWLGQLTQLQELNLSGNRLKALPESLGQLIQLQKLNLDENQLTALPESLGQISKLQSLNISANRLTALPEWLGKFTQLKSLNVFGNQLRTLPEWLGQLTKLIELNIGGNPLMVLPASLRQLTQLRELVIYQHPLGVLPEWIVKLTQLQELYLNENDIRALPRDLGQLTELRILQLDRNKLADLPASLAQIEHLTELTLHDNPLNPELAAAHIQGLDAVKRYLRAKAEAQIVLNEAKLILVGEGEVGKSCLLDALRGDPWMKHDTTHGIEIKPVKVTDPDSGTEITLNGWDFGGQRVYRPTHQLFFSAPAVYLVVWKPREGPEQGFVKDWIRLIKHREPEAKILVVATHGGPGQRQPDLDRQEFRDLFGRDTVLDFFYVDSKPDEKTGERRGIAELKEAIARVAAGLPEMGRTVPARWQQAREALKQTGEAYLPLERVLEICREHKMDDEEARLFVSISHRLGHLIHYEHDPSLRDIVVLKPDWLATAISFVLDDETTRNNHGLVTFSRLGQLWSQPSRAPEFRYPPELHPVFLRLMERFDLSYRVAGSPLSDQSEETSLIAQLVPDFRPEQDLHRVWPRDVAEGDAQQVQICRIVDTERGQSASAEGLFYRLIVRLHKYSLGRANYEESVHWQRGLVLDDDYNGRALLEHVGNDVRITVRAPYPEAFLFLLTREVKWLVEEDMWAGLRCDVMVPCVEPCGKSAPGTGLYEVQKLIESKKRQRPDYPCPICSEWQSIDCLLRNAPAARPNPLGELLDNSAEATRGLTKVRLQLRPQKLTGPQSGELHKALLSAFKINELRMMLKHRLDWDLDHLAGGATEPEIVFDLIRWANSRGEINNLFQAAREENPGNTELASIEEKFDWLSAEIKPIIGRFDILDASSKELISKVEASYTGLMQTLVDEGKDGPRLFSFQPIESGFFDRTDWISQKFQLTLWCEHSRLPLPALNGEEDRRGVYDLTWQREWFVRAAPFFKVLTATLSLVLPVASSATKLMIDDASYKRVEKELALGQKSLDSVLKGGEKFGNWLHRSEAPDLEHGEATRAQGAVLRELHAMLKKQDPGFGGLVRVQNKRQEFLWVHPQFEKEY